MNRPPQRQRGAALILAVVLLGLLALTTLSRALSAPPGLAETLATERALARARDALVGFAALGNSEGSQINSPGALPCPDLDNDGAADFSCAGHVGRLPWRTLGLGRTTDGSGECLWYARSPTYSNNIQTSTRGTGPDRPALNPATPGEIVEVSSTGPSGRLLAAAVFAPGYALGGQLRDAADPVSGCRGGSIGQFLEDVTVAGSERPHTSGLNTVSLLPEASFNDRVISLDTPRLFATASARVLAELRPQSIPDEGTRNADGTPVAEWWARNQWCSRLCMLGSDARIALSDGRIVARTLAVLPDCALPCS